MGELPRLVARTKPGTAATIGIWREGSERELKVTIGELPGETVAAAPTSERGETAGSLGLMVRELSAEERKALGVKNGLLVESVTKQAADTRIRRGDVITAVGQREVTGIEHFRALIREQKPGDSVALLVRRGDSALYVPVQVGTG